MFARPVPRRVIVDDIDPQIQYSSSERWGKHWILNSDGGHPQFAGGNPDPSGSQGQPFQSTTHLAVNTASSLSFRFRGSSPQIFGTNILTPISCSINGTNIPPINWRPTLANNMLLCDGTRFAGEDGEYILTLNVRAVYPESDTLFWFDYITYIPSPSVPLGSATLLVDKLDPAVVYAFGWRYPYGTATTTNGSQFTFIFTGTSVTCVGDLPPRSSSVPDQPLDPILAYTVDDGREVITGIHRPINTTPYINPHSNYIYFETPQLSPGPHSLVVVVVYNNTGGPRTPLTLTHLVVRGDAPPPASLPPDASSSLPPDASASLPPVMSSTATTIPNNTQCASAPVGAIVGGFIGGIAISCLVAFLLWRYKHRWSIQVGRLHLGHDDTAPLQFIVPFDATPSRLAGAGAGSRRRKASHIRVEDLAGPSGTRTDPGTTPRARKSNRNEISPDIPLVDIGVVHEDDNTRDVTDAVVGPPPSYGS